MEILIKKAGITSGLFLSYEFEQTDSNVKNINKTKSDLPIHDDLRRAFRALIPHFVFICEEIKDETIIENAINNYDDYLLDQETSKHPEFFKYYVSDFTITGKGDAEKLKISGSKSLESFESISWTAPEILLDSTKYKFVESLKESVAVLKREVLAYMEGKHAPKAQMEMFSDEEEDETSYEASVSFTTENGETVEHKIPNDFFKKPAKNKGKKAIEEEI